MDRSVTRLPHQGDVVVARSADAVDRFPSSRMAGQLLIAALRERDEAHGFADSAARARHLASTSHDLAMSLDENTTRDTVRGVHLTRAGTWCIVEVVEPDGLLHRLPAVHPDPAKRDLALSMAQYWPAGTAVTTVASTDNQPRILTPRSGPLLIQALRGEATRDTLDEIGFAFLIVVPMVVRARITGVIMFVCPDGAAPPSPEDVALASEIGAQCALALDNARLYTEAGRLRVVAEASSRAKTAFLATMSHELRTPLNVIGGYADLIDAGVQGPVTAKQQRSLSRIKFSQHHLLTLITGILDYAGITEGHVVYHTAEVTLSGVMVEMAEMLGGAIADAGMVVETDPCEPDGVAWADRDRVFQILVNLVTNAVKYASDGKHITLTCGTAADRVFVRVADRGPGIAAPELESIFMPFVQLNTGLSDRKGGVGLGLAISRDLARGMGGDVTVKSTHGAGTTFTLSLPRAPSPRRRRRREAAD